jgi:hypothetical protein
MIRRYLGAELPEHAATQGGRELPIIEAFAGLKV